MAQLPLPVGKHEFYDGTNWYSKASENWVINQIRRINPCVVATVSNLNATYTNGIMGVGATLTNSGVQAALNIDGINLAVGHRVLVKDQTTQTQNGIYSVTNIGSVSTNWILTRSTECDTIEQMIRGDIIPVMSGTLSEASLWMLTTSVAAIGTNAITYVKTDQNSYNSILGTTNQINVSVVGGVATISIATNPVIPGNGSVTIPTGTTVQRPSTPVAGMLRYNTSL